MAAMGLNQGFAAGILNLRSLNPYVATAVADWRKVAAPVPLLSRQTAPNQAVLNNLSMAGASSFGMSGVNAHVLLGMQTTVAAPEESHQAWKRSRCNTKGYLVREWRAV